MFVVIYVEILFVCVLMNGSVVIEFLFKVFDILVECFKRWLWR